MSFNDLQKNPQTENTEKNSFSGQKYEFARKWRIPIVSPAWLFDCVEARYCLDHHKYRVDTKDTDSREPGTSTPNVSK